VAPVVAGSIPVSHPKKDSPAAPRWGIIPSGNTRDSTQHRGPVAQLDRASDFGSSVFANISDTYSTFEYPPFGAFRTLWKRVR
jgi:hypothetical protein